MDGTWDVYKRNLHFSDLGITLITMAGILTETFGNGITG